MAATLAATLVVVAAFGLYWLLVGSSIIVTAGIYSILIFQWFAMLSIFKHVRPEKALKQHNQLLCPGCCYPLCELNFDPDEPITCPECGGSTTGQQILNAWLKVPVFKRAYKKHYH